MKKLIPVLLLTTFSAFGSVSHTMNISIECENFAKDVTAVSFTMQQNKGIDIDFVMSRLDRPGARESYLGAVKSASEFAVLKEMSPIETYNYMKSSCLSSMSKAALRGEK